MGVLNQGFGYFKDGNELLMMIVVSNDGRVTNIYEPTESDVSKVCHEFDFDFDEIMGLIENKEPWVHTLLIDESIYKAKHADI